MPSERFAGRIRESLAGGERFDDFAYMFDTLVALRRPFHDDLTVSEEVVGRILCVFVPDKPARYLRAMQEFRLRFAGVSSDPQLGANFSNCIRPAALAVRSANEIVWTPSVYFFNPWMREAREWF
jgi:hypothetical protein